MIKQLTHTHIYTHNVILVIKRKKNAIFSNMDGPRGIILSEVNQKDKYYMISLYMKYKK